MRDKGEDSVDFDKVDHNTERIEGWKHRSGTRWQRQQRATSGGGAGLRSENGGSPEIESALYAVANAGTLSQDAA
ncbi:hypothetical protein J6590_012216 [Homalodisca vitripennis]|nr:hypothetical protein J6590_012216 [Homalodisca vitripennis]